jgi:hypothetical protein
VAQHRLVSSVEQEGKVFLFFSNRFFSNRLAPFGIL